MLHSGSVVGRVVTVSQGFTAYDFLQHASLSKAARSLASIRDLMEAVGPQWVESVTRNTLYRVGGRECYQGRMETFKKYRLPSQVKDVEPRQFTGYGGLDIIGYYYSVDDGLAEVGRPVFPVQGIREYHASVRFDGSRHERGCPSSVGMNDDRISRVINGGNDVGGSGAVLRVEREGARPGTVEVWSYQGLSGLRVAIAPRKECRKHE